MVGKVTGGGVCITWGVIRGIRGIVIPLKWVEFKLLSHISDPTGTH
jgi:hypothetical protein